MELGIGIKSEWEIILKDAATGVVKQHIPWHKNVILDVGLNLALTTTQAFMFDYNFPHPTYHMLTYIAVGTGSNAPAVTDVGLQTQLMRKIAKSQDSAVVSTTDPTAPYCIIGTTFTESEANGDLKEVGLCTASTGGTFFNRDLFRDGGGNPVTITKTSNDLLVVKCKITAKRVSETPSSYNVTASDSTVHAVKGILTNAGLEGILSRQSFWPTSGVIYTGTNSVDPAPADTNVKTSLMGASVQTTTPVSHTGPTGGFYRDYTFIANPSDCNQNISEMAMFPGGAFGSRFTFSPALVKTSAKKLTISMRVTLSRL